MHFAQIIDAHASPGPSSTRRSVTLAMVDIYSVQPVTTGPSRTYRNLLDTMNTIVRSDG